MTNEQVAGIRDEVAALLTKRLAALPDETAGLQRAARALRQAESIDQWVQIVADAAAVFADRIVVFGVEGDKAVAKAIRGPGALPAAVNLADAPALRQVVESSETLVCLNAASQLGEAVVAPVIGRRVSLTPVVGKTRVLGVLCAEGEVRLAGLETLASLAAGSLELRKAPVNAPLILPAAVVTEPEHQHPVETAAPAEVLPVDWRALRAAKVAVAKFVLANAGQLAQARARGKVQAALRVPIESVRISYKDSYPGKESYLEEELTLRLPLTPQ